MSQTPETPTAIVFGASGFTGRAVVPALVARGARVFAHIRPDSTRLDVLRPEFEEAGAVVDTTPWDPDALNARVAELQPDMVFGLLGITLAGARREARRTGREAETFRSVDYRLTAMAIDACAAAGSRPRFVYLSSLGVSDKATGAYLKARWEAEQHLRASGLPYTIARPSFITGDRDENRLGESVGAAVVDAGLSVLGALGARKLQDRFRSRDNVELAASLVEAAFDPRCADRILESVDL